MNLYIILFSLGAVAIIVLIIGIIVSISTEKSAVDERLEQVVGGTEILAQDKSSKADKGASTPLVDWLNKRAQGSSWGEKVNRDLARADLKMKAGEYAALMMIAAIGLGGLVWFMTGMSIIGGLIGVAVGLYLPGLYVKRQQGQRLQKFNDQLGDMLSLMVNGLRAGFSTPQAMENVSKELPPPICDEFRRVVQEMQLGIPMPQALDNLLRRIPSDDLDLCITAINVQREVGGNLAEILDTISFTIRERVRVKGEIKTLTTQVMYSGRVLSFMPVAVMGILYLLNREYMMQFFLPENNLGRFPLPFGICVLIIAALLIVMGYFAMNKLADIEV
jgi:tight adherence protein B